ncbi:hypothetical protein KAT51_06050, partial [bacterium]|nr:hypothetical protein [bacterium]
PEGIKRSVTGFFEGFDVSSGISYIFEPFKHTGKLKGEEVIEVKSPAFGTVYTDPVTGKEQPYEKYYKGTKFEYAKLQKEEAGKQAKYIGLPPAAASLKLSEDISSKIRPKYQSKIDTGQLTLEQAEKQFIEEHKKKYSKEVIGLKTAYAKQPKGLYERTGTRITKAAPIITETGLLIGGAFTPAGSAIVSTYIIGRGFGQTVEAETTLGKGIGIGTMGLGFTGVGVTMSALRASLTRGKIMEAVGKKPEFKVGIRQELTKDLTMDFTLLKYRAGDVQVIKETTALAKRLPLEKDLYEISAKGAVVVRTTEEFTGKSIYYGFQTQFKGLGTGVGTTKAGWSPSLVKGQAAKTVEFFAKIKQGKPPLSYETRFESIRADFFSKIEKGKPLSYKARIDLYGKPEDIIAGAISKKAQDKIFSFGGEVKKAGYTYYTGKGFKAIDTKTIRYTFDVEEVTVLKVVKPKKPITFKELAGKPRTPLSKTFTEQKAIPPAKLKQITQTPQVPTTEILSQKLTTLPSKSLLKQIKISIKVEQRYIVALVSSTSQVGLMAAKTETKLRGAYSFRQPVLLSSRLLLREGLIPGQKSFLKMRLKTLQIETTMQAPPVTGKPTVRVKPGIDIGGRINIPSFPGLSLEQPGKEKGERGIQPQKYLPSLTAAALNIKAFSIPKSYYAGAGGITLRPIIKRSKR